MYGGSAPGVRVGGPVIYYGTFATGLFQTAYQPGPAHWATLPSTLEWHVVAAAVGLAGFLWYPLWVLAGLMLLMSFGVAGVLAYQAKLPCEYDGFRSRLVVAALSYAQPLVRSWQRRKTWLFAFPAPSNGAPDPIEGPSEPVLLTGGQTVEYWSEERRDRTELLNKVVASWAEHRWGLVIDSGWSAWDLEVSGDRYSMVRVATVQEEHGDGRLIRVRFQVQPRSTFWLLAGLGAALTAVTALVNPGLAAAPAVAALGSLAYAWRRALRTARHVYRVFAAEASRMKLIRCDRPKLTAPP
jgi:hypothetical protein